MSERTAVSREDVVETLRELLGEFEVEPDDVTPEAEFEALGLDSLDLVEMSVKVEDAYEIDISEEDLEPVRTVGDAADVVVKKVEAKG